MIRIDRWWMLWFALISLLTAYYANALVGTDKNIYLPGNTSNGHYQIENNCQVCHGDGFSDRESLQKSCLQCHAKELKAINDSHPKSKFTNPRNADRIAILDARYCVTCHEEHKTEKTQAMGVTMPQDFCFLCHQDVAKNRPSHEGMPFNSCADAGCHNYHDNKALYEDFLVKHNGEKDNLPIMRLPNKNLKEVFHQKDNKFKSVLMEKDMDHPDSITVSQNTSYQWRSTAHAKSGVNCNACHMKDKEWQFRPDHKACDKCHDNETSSFLSGRHGMRLAEGLSPMKVANGRLKFKKTAADKALNCQSCHSDHSFNTTFAGIDACLTCHDDKHSRTYKKSKHYRALLQSSAGEQPNIQSVSCANCHMPRVVITENGIKRVLVDHNQNNSLRPNEKMARSVCMNCHGLKFSLEALADINLINNNFEGLPSEENKGFDMVMEREELKRKGLLKGSKK